MIYWANINIANEEMETIRIETDKQIHEGEVIEVDEISFKVFEVRHKVFKTGRKVRSFGPSEAHLDCEKM